MRLVSFHRSATPTVSGKEAIHRPARGRSRSGRRGVTAVECAVVLPIVVLFILGIIEFGRVMMVQQILTNGAREGARRAAVASSSGTDVNAVVEEYMKGCHVANYQMTMTDLSTAEAGDVVQVTVSVLYEDVTWLPGPLLWGLGGKTLSVTAGMVKEASLDDLTAQAAPGSTSSGSATSGSGVSDTGGKVGKGKRR